MNKIYDLVNSFSKSEKFFDEIKEKLIYDDFEIDRLKIQNLRTLIIKIFWSINEFNKNIEEFKKDLDKRNKLLKKQVEFLVFYSKYKNYFFNKI